MDPLTYTVYVTATVTEEQVIDALQIDPAKWAALDEEMRWAVLRSKEATAAAMGIALQQERCVSDDCEGLPGRLMHVAEDFDCDQPEPESLQALERAHSWLGHNRRVALEKAAARFLRPWEPTALPDSMQEVPANHTARFARMTADECIGVVGGSSLDAD